MNPFDYLLHELELDHSTADYAVTPRLRSQAEAVAQRHPQPMVEIFEGAGHALFVDEPARFNASMEEFLARKAAWG